MDRGPYIHLRWVKVTIYISNSTLPMTMNSTASKSGMSRRGVCMLTFSSPFRHSNRAETDGELRTDWSFPWSVSCSQYITSLEHHTWEFTRLYRGTLISTWCSCGYEMRIVDFTARKWILHTRNIRVVREVCWFRVIYTLGVPEASNCDVWHTRAIRVWSRQHALLLLKPVLPSEIVWSSQISAGRETDWNVYINPPSFQFMATSATQHLQQSTDFRTQLPRSDLSLLKNLYILIPPIYHHV